MEENILERDKFIKEVNYIIENISQNQFAIIIRDSFYKSLKAVLISKKDALINMGDMIVKIGKDAHEFIKDEIHYIKLDPEGYVRSIIPRLKYKSVDAKDKLIEVINDKIDYFKSLSYNEKKDIITSGLLWASTVLVVGGGIDFEGGIPDSDIKVGGINNHRNPFSHTILVGLALEFFLRLSINLLTYGRNYLPRDNNKLWDYIEKISITVERNENVLVSGMWWGLAIHFLKDANIGSNRVKPYVGMPYKMSNKAHQRMFAGNSFLSFAFGSNKNDSI